MTSPRSSHPHFDDRGTLAWHTRWAEALAAAQEGPRLVLIELGRGPCSQCRSLVEAILPRPDVAALLQQHFVALAADADDTEPEVEELAMNLEDATMLPFVVVADAEGRFVDGVFGAQSPPGFLAFLERVLERSR